MKMLVWVCLTLAAAAVADGGYFPTQISVDHWGNGDQHAVLLYEPDTRRQTLVLSTTYEGMQTGFAWVIPTPSLPAAADVRTLDNGYSLFYGLSEIAAPAAAFPPYHAGCIGCGATADASATTGTADGVLVANAFTIGDTAITTLSATDANALTRWLAENGYAVPDTAAGVFGAYIDAGWKFVCVKVPAPTGAYPDQTGFTPGNPLALTCQTEAPVFPMRISSINGDPHGSDLLLYVITTATVHPTTFPWAAMRFTPGPETTPREFMAAYDRQRGEQAVMATGHGILVEYAGVLRTAGAWHAPAPLVETYASSPSLLTGALLPLLAHPDGTYYLTRLRGNFTPAQMTHDIILAADATPQAVRIAVDYRTQSASNKAALLLCTGLGAFTLRRRRRGLSTLLFVLLALFAVAL